MGESRHPKLASGNSGEITTNEIADGVYGERSERFEIAIKSPAELVHCLLFVQEFAESTTAFGREQLAPIAFFLQRTGGLHLLLLLLNAAYQKPPVGRLPGWPFGVLRARAKMSERSLRQLLADGIAAGMVERRYGQADRRRLVYGLTPCVLTAWSQLFDACSATLPDVLSTLSQNELADIDYGVWNPRRPAIDQFPRRAVYLYLKSAIDPNTVHTRAWRHTVSRRCPPSRP